jgi:DNA-binding transcriptional LysR family regulator
MMNRFYLYQEWGYMDIRKIEAFSKVYEHCSFSKAGKSLYLSQPTISAHVASLEQELEVQLFDRIGRSVVPTKAGEVLYLHARKIFEASELAISELRKLQDRITGKLDIGGSTIPANYIMPEILAKFWKKYPEVIMDLRIGDSEDIVTQVRDNALMLGVVGAVFDSPDLHYEKIASDSLVLVMTPQLYRKSSQSASGRSAASLAMGSARGRIGHAGGHGRKPGKVRHRHPFLCAGSSWCAMPAPCPVSFSRDGGLHYLRNYRP